jgi:hypothetical protein
MKWNAGRRRSQPRPGDAAEAVAASTPGTPPAPPPARSVWHAPLILMGYNFPAAPVLGVALMTLFCVLLAPLFHLVRLRGGTIWHACLCHGTINAGARLSELCVSSEHWSGRGILGVSGFVTLAAVCVGVGLFRRYSER